MSDHKAIREALETGPTEGPWVHNKQGYPKSDVRAAGDGGRASLGNKRPEISKAEREHTPPRPCPLAC